ncbi:MAG: multicopper oxidase domain-containing protein [Candidatus Hodarchaeales archaeon]|jgi:nitrite reductase (NO-forming)
MAEKQIQTKSLALLGTLFVGLFIGAMIGLSFSPSEGSVALNEETFILEAHFSGFVGISDNIKGKVNPDLSVSPNTKVTIILSAGDALTHNFVIDSIQENDDTVSPSGPTDLTLVFTIEDEGVYTYYCSIPGHFATMNGRLVVGEGSLPGPAQTTDVDSIIRNPTDIPGPVGARAAQDVNIVLTANEVVAEIEDGTTIEFWTFNQTIPGPLLRVRVGDNVTVTLINPSTNMHRHSIDLHAVTDNGGGAAYTQVDPGETKSFFFNASHEGSFVYHCAPNQGSVPAHISLGMYGAISVEPAAGLPAIDKEFYVGQSEVYTKWAKGSEGHQQFDDQRMLDENPNYVLFNGKVNGLTDPSYSLNATVDDDIRIFFAVGGPNLASNFHIIGEVMDKVWYETSTSVPNMVDAETVIVAPGSTIMIEMNVEKVGRYLLVDHALSRTFDKGSLGFLYVNA